MKQCENKKLRQFWRKYLTPVVNGLDELSGVIGGTGTAIYLLSKVGSLTGYLVQVVSNIPQAMPLAIVWGGLKFMMGVSGWPVTSAPIYTKGENPVGSALQYYL